jgi:superfamily II DNA helicase RecQ
MFLTATLPKVLEGTLFNRMLLSKLHTVVYRQPTWRKTIQYEVVDSKGASTKDIVAGMVRKLSAGFVTGQRGVLYVRSYEAGRRLQEKLHKTGLDIPFYKAVADDKSEIFKAWAEGSGGSPSFRTITFLKHLQGLSEGCWGTLSPRKKCMVR